MVLTGSTVEFSRSMFCEMILTRTWVSWEKGKARGATVFVGIFICSGLSLDATATCFISVDVTNKLDDFPEFGIWLLFFDLPRCGLSAVNVSILAVSKKGFAAFFCRVGAGADLCNWPSSNFKTGITGSSKNWFG